MSRTARLQSTSSPPVTYETGFPVARYATLVSLKEPRHDTLPALEFLGDHQGLDYDEFHTALEHAKNLSPFQKVIEGAVKAGLAKLGAKGSLLNTTLPISKPLKAHRGDGIYDVIYLKEFAFRLNGALILARASMYFPLKSALNPQSISHGKFAVRFALAEHPHSQDRLKRAVDLSPSIVQEFERQCAVIADRVFEAMREPYKSLIRDATGKKDIVAEIHNRLGVLSLESRTYDFRKSYGKVDNGEKLLGQLDTDVGAQTLARLAARIFYPGTKEMTDGELATFIKSKKDLDLFPSGQPIDGHYGIVLRKLDKETVQFVGLSGYIGVVGENGKTIEPFRHDARNRAFSAHLMDNHLQRF